MSRLALVLSLAVAALVSCRSEPDPTGCALCSPNATCAERATGPLCICNPAFVGDGRTCGATGLQPGSPWPAEGGNAAHSRQSVFSGPKAKPTAARWRFSTGSRVTRCVGVENPVIAADGTIYFACQDGRIYAIDPSGQQKWLYTEAGVPWSTPAIGANGTLYVHGELGTSAKLVAIDPSVVVSGTPTVRWSLGTGEHDIGHYISAPVVGADGTIYVGTTGQLAAVKDAGSSGVVQWTATIGSRFAAAIDAGGTIYVAGFDFSASALRPNDGSILWSLRIGYPDNPPALGPDGTLYALGDEPSSALFAIAADSGQTRWTRSVSILSVLSVGGDGTVYVRRDGALLALDGRGEPKPGWPFVLTSGFSSPTIGADGMVYVVAGRELHAIADGALAWSFTPGGFTEFTWFMAAPAIGADGTLYAGDNDGYLNAIGP